MDNKTIIISAMSAVIAVTIIICYFKFMPKIPLKEYTKLCLYFAAMDDEICRNELEGNFVNGKKILFPPKDESIHYRYKLFLDTYKKYTRKELEQERERFIKRLEESQQYIGTPKQELELEITKD